LLSDVTEVDKLRVSVNICFLVLKLQNLNTFKNTTFEEIVASLATSVGVLLTKSIASVLGIGIVDAARQTLAKILFLHLFHHFFD